MYLGTKYEEERRIREKRKKEVAVATVPPILNSDYGGAKVQNQKSLI
jgi:hypothetical protein